jgi:hypothetical protein
MAEEYVYWGTILLDDGTEEVLNLEVHGWAEPTRLARVKRFALVPNGREKTLSGEDYPVVVVNIPEKAKPVFKTRVKVSTGKGEEIRVPASIRCYGVGYKLGRHEHILWVIPTGAIEVGPETFFGDQLLSKLTHSGVIAE